MHLNHPKITPTPVHEKNYLPQHQSLVPKRLAPICVNKIYPDVPLSLMTSYGQIQSPLNMIITNNFKLRTPSYDSRLS